MSPDDLFKILLAIGVGGIIGIEREFRDKAAGFRTLIFICLGSALFTMFSVSIAGPGNDPTRIASSIVTGVGFLGAGVILREGGHVLGLTTAATVWLVAALGMGIGAAEHTIALVVAGISLLILGGFPLIERWVDRVRDERSYEVVAALSAEKASALDRLFRDSGLRVLRHRQAKNGARMTCCWQVAGSRDAHDWVVQRLLADPEVDELRY
jgi:putative Mg2+ transporter-C (MgtC) family protein